MNADERGNRIESATMARVGEIYAEAMQQAVRNQKAFLAKIKAIDEGRLKPPQWYVDRGMEDKWRQGFLRELLRREKVVEGFMKELNSAGNEAAQLIRESMVEIYQANREETTQRLTDEASRMYDEDLSFTLYDKRQIGVILQKNQSPMSKLAYKNMGQNPVIRRNLQNALAQSILLGESQRDLLKRIQRITGQTVSQARRVAQTERTRVQSQARVQAGEEARQKGVEVYHEWSCAFIPPHKTRHGFSSGSRESHMDLDGKTALAGEAFHTIWGNELRYPGDPSAPAREVINCHCTMIPHVLLKGEKLESSEALSPQKRWDDLFNKKHLSQGSEDLLPRHTKAYGISEKLNQYCLNMDHPVGRNKALVFDSALGYNVSNSDQLEAEIRRGLVTYRATPKGDNGFGKKFVVVMLITGANGKKQPVVTSWIVERDAPRMVTAYVDKDQRP